MESESGIGGGAFESGPKNFTAILADETDFRKEVHAGNHWLAICIDIKKGIVYFGNNHSVMLHNFPIEQENYYKGILTIDEDEKVGIHYLWDMRTSSRRKVEEEYLKQKILAAVNRDIIGKST